MKCKACDNNLKDSELLVNTEEAFIKNECLCLSCLSVSNEEVNLIIEEQKEKLKKRKD